MQQFDSYIKSIVKDLNISKAQMKEITDEFRDHLEMLAKDYMNEGNTEEAAVEKAIKSFGDTNLLRKKLFIDLHYRSIPNVLFGMGYILLVLLVFKAYMNTQFQYFQLSSDMTLFQVIVNAIIRLIPIVTLVFSPIGYFLPIIFKQINKQKHLVGINGILSIVYLCYMIYRVNNVVMLAVDVPHIIIFGVACQAVCIISGVLLSSVLGYKLLCLINNKLFISMKTMSSGF